MTYDPMMLLEAYRRMRAIREFEERMRREVQAGTVPGFVHLYCGQEAVAVGACMNLLDSDYIGSTHRGHGHCIAKGCDIGAMLLEIYCKQGGLCNGKGGSMHIADLRKGMLGANAIVGGAPPIADRRGADAQDTQDRRRRDGVHRRRRVQPGHGRGIVEFFGGAETADDLHVREQRLLGIHRHRLPPRWRRHRSARAARSACPPRKWTASISSRCTTRWPVQSSVRGAGHGPSAVEAFAMRWYGHFEGDMQKYRESKEVDRLRKSPIRSSNSRSASRATSTFPPMNCARSTRKLPN